MHLSYYFTTIVVSVLFCISRTAAVPLPHESSGPIHHPWIYNASIPVPCTNNAAPLSTTSLTPSSTSSTILIITPTPLPSPPPPPPTPYYSNGTTTGPIYYNSTYPWMTNSTSSTSSSSGSATTKPSSSSTSGKPIPPSATATLQPFQGGAASSLGSMAGSPWALVIAVIAAMAVL